MFFYSVVLFLRGDYNWIHHILTPLKEIFQVSATQGNLVLWFLPSLFMVKVIFSLLKKWHIKCLWIAILFLLLLILLYVCGNPLPIYMSAFCTGMFYYSAGNMSKSVIYDKKVIAIAFFVFISIYLFKHSAVNMKDNALMQGSYCLWFLYSVAACLAFTRIFMSWGTTLHVFSYIGRQAMFILCTHWIIITVASEFIPKCSLPLWFDNYTANILSIVVCVEIILLLIINVFKRFIQSFKYETV